ncbi:protein BEAN1 isoform X2 [Anolis carolinensis]|uniref:protein BEAN1 isoform X2 n=1 Tax=Anolis carolinensis TaxID=28377 RepID=UPI0004625FEC|nr:PREDICTED: protein BEAN1 [Anolis carolinensis]|eukprot:XP_003225390.2 PREDICTED: protein BEAN1 [Anolis carolinensis]
MERKASWMGSGTAVRLGAGHNHSKPYEKSTVPCKKEQLHCGNGPCLMNWLRCRYKKDCGKDNVSITVACSEIHLNKTSPINVFTHYTAAIGCVSMPDSSVLVAGVVIGLVLFLSCVAIIVGSLRKKRCFRHLQLQRDVSYTPDCFSYGGGSIGELRPSCIEEFSPAFYFSSYMETLSQVNITHPDSPPRYDECVGPEATQIYIPTDDPPPYSLIDPCQQNGMTPSIAWRGGGGGGEMGPGTATEWDAGHLLSLQDLPQPIPSISLLSSSFPMEAAPPYETVVHEQTTTLPLAQLDLLKNSTDYYQTSSNRIS